MTGANPEDLRAKQDIRCAVVLMSLAEGISRDESAAVLQYDAAAAGVSLHTAALVVLSPPATTEPFDVESPAAPRRRRHMYAVSSEEEIDAACSAGPVGSAG